MKIFTTTLALILVLGVSTAFAGNRPELTYPAGQLAITSGTVEVTPWNKGALAYEGGIVVAKAGNGVCPVMKHRITSKHNVVIALSNGKNVEVCCPSCKQEIEKDLAKYQEFMF